MSTLKILSLFTTIILFAAAGAAHAQPEKKEDEEKGSTEEPKKNGEEEIEPVTEFTGEALPPHEETEPARRPAAPGAPLTPSGEEEEIEPVTEFTGEALPIPEEPESAARPAGRPGAPIIPGTEAPTPCPPCEISDAIEYIIIFHSVTCTERPGHTCRDVGESHYYFTDARGENTETAQGATFDGAGDYSLNLAYRFSTPEGLYFDMTFDRPGTIRTVAFHVKIERPVDLAPNAVWSNTLLVFGEGPGRRDVDMTFQYTIYPVIAED